jgi:hypothetical protein
MQMKGDAVTGAGRQYERSATGPVAVRPAGSRQQRLCAFETVPTAVTDITCKQTHQMYSDGNLDVLTSFL